MTSTLKVGRRRPSSNPRRLGRWKQTTEERFLSKVQKTDTCWLWQAGQDASGYGLFFWSGRTGLAHRYSWELHRGPVPEGQCVLHDCPGGDNPQCCNPDHLWLGDNAQNVADRVAKGRSGRSPGTHNGRAKLTPEQVRAIFQRHGQGESQERIGTALGVSQSVVGRILAGKLWKHL